MQTGGKDALLPLCKALQPFFSVITAFFVLPHGRTPGKRRFFSFPMQLFFIL
jgi:hypothetical protein